MAADVILVVGSTGAGKTTYARRLAEELGGVRFSIDEWMMALFWPDSPQPIEFAWTMERVNRCEAVIFSVARQSVARGVPAILDLGFTTKAHRDKFRDLAECAGLSAHVHFVDVPGDQRWARVEQRNAERGETYAMQVDRAMFDFMETFGNRRPKRNGARTTDAASLADVPSRPRPAPAAPPSSPTACSSPSSGGPSP